MNRIRQLTLALATALLAGGTCLLSIGCDTLDLAWAGISSINPCGTILTCDPQAYEFYSSNIDSPGVEPDVDPFCTYAPFCTADEDPIFGGLAP